MSMAVDMVDMYRWNAYLRGRQLSYLDPNYQREPDVIESIFSYVFGDGDPNVGLAEEQLKRAAEVRRAACGMRAFLPPSSFDATRRR